MKLLAHTCINLKKSFVNNSKEPGPIASFFLKTFEDFGIRRELIFFSLPWLILQLENVPFERY